MQKVMLGNTGEQVSAMSLGAMLMGTTIDPQASAAMLDSYLEEGGNFIDTANCYAWWAPGGQGGESETLLGRWMKERGNRQQIFLASKVGAKLRDVSAVKDAQGNIAWEKVPQTYEYLAPATIRAGVEDSLRRLQTDYIDLYYAHIDDPRMPIEDVQEALNRLVQEGKVRYTGCSNFHTWRLERSRAASLAKGWAPYTAIQQEFSYFRPRRGADFGIGVHTDEELRHYLRANPQVTLVAYSPLLKGIYDDAAKREAYYNWPIYNHPDTHARLEVLTSLARELGVSNSQLVLAWILHQRPTIIPIMAASRMEQYRHNMQALKIQLTAEQVETLNQAGG